MKPALIVVALLVCCACDPPYGAHLSVGNPHVGYPPGSIIPIRDAPWYDETGAAPWVAAEQTYANTWAALQSREASHGHRLPILPFHTQGGRAGCGNELGGFDVCVGNLPRAGPDGRTVVAITFSSLDAQKHVLYDHIEVPGPGWGSAAQRLEVICHETGHVLGLAHNTANMGSCMQAVIPSPPPPTLGSDDVTELERFYDGHAE